MITEMIMDVTVVGNQYTTRQIKDRLFDWQGNKNQRTNRNGNTRVRYIPTINAMPIHIRKSKVFNEKKTRKGIIWTRRNEE